MPFGIAGGQRRRQGTGDRAQLAGQGQLTHKFTTAQAVFGNLTGGGQNAQGNRQVKPSAFFGQIGGREVDGNPPGGKFQVTVEDGTAHPVLAFLHGGFRQAHHIQGGQAVGEMNFDGDQRSLDSEFCA